MPEHRNGLRSGFAAAAAMAALAGLALPASASPAPLVIGVEQGRLQGVGLDGGVSFRGVPFAAPPVGPLRWRPPAPARSWRGVRDATRFGLPCAQPDLGWNGVKTTGSSEDCLTLNIWAPTAARGLPVMVWIHGGAFQGGSGVDPMFDGTALMKHGVVVVTLNYRLGVLGFLAHPDLAAESAHHASGDYAFYDQAAALRWVQRNIARFGGDPRRVTLFGQSAGAASVGALMTSPLARGLFARSIIESGPPFALGDYKTAAEAGEAVRDWGRIDDLRKLPVEALLASWGRFVAADPGKRSAGPVVDGAIITRSPDVAFASGLATPMASIVGNNSRESMGPPGPDALTRAFGAEADQARPYYGAVAADPVLGDGTSQLATDTVFRCPTVMTQAARATSGNAVFAYQFEEPLPGRAAQGAGHSFELPYVFGNMSPGGFLGGDFSPPERALSADMQAYWTNFAKRGDPNGPGLPHWGRFQPGTAAYMVLAAGRVGAREGLRAGPCALYRRHWEKTHDQAGASRP